MQKLFSRRAFLLTSIFSVLVPVSTVFAKPIVGSVTPTSATKDVAVELRATVSSGVSIQSCNLYVDLADAGAMTVSGGVASKYYTFTSGGSRIAFVFCKDTSGGMTSGANTSIWVEGAIVTAPPLSSTEPNPTTTSTVTAPQPSTTSTPETTIPPVATSTEATTGSLIKLRCNAGDGADHPCRAVYYYGADGKRHAFPNEKVYFTWYTDFSNVSEVGATTMSAIGLGKNVTYRAGSKMVKFTTDPKVYAVDSHGNLRWVQSEALATGLYGADWNTKIDDIADVFYTNYTFGAAVSSVSEYSVTSVMMLNATIDSSY